MYRFISSMVLSKQELNTHNSRFLSLTSIHHSLQTLFQPARACRRQPIIKHTLQPSLRSANTQRTSSLSPSSRMFCVKSSSFFAYRHILVYLSHCSWPQRLSQGQRHLSTLHTRPLLNCRCFSSSLPADELSGNINTGSLRRKPTNKVRTFFVCENCGESYGQWWGKCNSCKMQGSLKKFSKRLADEGGGAGLRAAEGIGAGLSPQGQASSQGVAHSQTTLVDVPIFQGTSKLQIGKPWLKVGSVLGPQRLTDVLKGISDCQWRMPLTGGTGMEIARVLGGGLVPGSLILLGGDPGVGKSTLLLQLCSIMAEGCEFYKPAPVLYVSGEESEEQISSRADRLHLTSSDLFLYSATDLELILNSIQQLRPRAVVIDSIQTVYLPEAVGSAGNVVQVRECAAALLRLAKRSQIPIFLVGHVTRSGDIAGPRVLEHIVDVVLYLEGENGLSHRILRVVKNRFGSTDEVGVFEMMESGLVVVENPSQLFLNQREEEMTGPVSGAIAVTMEGSRPFLVEIQALCSGMASQANKHMVNGVDPQRLHIILAVLSKLAGVKAQHQNVLISVVGGFQVREPAVDLAVAVAICSSYLEKQIPPDMAFVGEIGLGGEIRPVRQLDRRILEITKLGFKWCVIPKVSEKALRACTVEAVTLIRCATIQEVIQTVVYKFTGSSEVHTGASKSTG